MTLGGWIVMLLAVTGITGLLVWCVTKVIRIPDAPEHLHSQVDIDPGDRDA